MELQSGEKQAASDSRFQCTQPHLSSELLARERSAPWHRYPAGDLDIADHFFASNPIGWTAHYRQHLEWSQGLKSLGVLAKIEPRHGLDSLACD
jgi:hypothetical protein